jgi:hypothetical protein
MSQKQWLWFKVSHKQLGCWRSWVVSASKVHHLIPNYQKKKVWPGAIFAQALRYGDSQ